MPEVKWVTPNNIHTNAEAQCINASLEKEALPKLQFTPVLTLDDIEAWLELRRKVSSDVHGYVLVDSLLAQVRAFKRNEERLAHDAAQRARMAALEQEHAGCKASLRHILLDNDKVHAQLATLTAERDRLKEALKFYADPQTYFAKRGVLISQDMGKIAQAALRGRGDDVGNKMSSVW